MRRNACDCELNFGFGDCDLIESRLLVISIIVLADDDLDLFKLVSAVAQFNYVLTAQRIQFVEYD